METETKTVYSEERSNPGIRSSAGEGRVGTRPVRAGPRPSSRNRRHRVGLAEMQAAPSVPAPTGLSAWVAESGRHEPSSRCRHNRTSAHRTRNPPCLHGAHDALPFPPSARGGSAGSRARWRWHKHTAQRRDSARIRRARRATGRLPAVIVRCFRLSYSP